MSDMRKMGNCANCYYFTGYREASEAGYDGTCHRFPCEVEKDRFDYCGEFVDLRVVNEL